MEKVYQHLSEAFPKINSYKNIISLDLSEDKFNLLDLEELDKDFDYRTIYACINIIDLTKNSLTLLKLKGFNNLESVIARENYINKVELNLPRLKKLDLSNNMINKIFELNSINSLEELKLNKNLIERITWEDLKPVKNSLTTLEIASNKINFNSVREFFDFIEQFGKSMKKLKTFNITGNNFTSSKIYRDYSLVITHYCQTVKVLNNKAVEQITPDENALIGIDKIKKRILDDEKRAGTLIFNNLEENLPIGEEISNVSIEDINKELEKYNNLGKFNQSSIQNLISLIESYIKSGSYLSNMIGDNELEDRELNSFENFLEYTDLLINSNNTLEKPFAELIAKFSYIKNGKFCSRSMDYLKNKISPEKAREYEDILKSTVLNYIIKTPDDNIFNNIISGCEKFANDSKFIRIISNIFPRILNLIIRKKDFQFNSNDKEVKRRKEILWESLSFVSVCIKESTNMREVLNNTFFINAICVLIKNVFALDDTTINSDIKIMKILIELLKITTMICLSKKANNDKNLLDNVNRIIGSGLKDKFQQNLNSRLQEKSKNTSMRDIEKKEIILCKMEILTNIIRCYGSLLMRTKDINKLISDQNSVPSKIINMLVQNSSNDPMLISAACDFTYYIFHHTDMSLNKDNCFEKASSKLYSLRYIIKYIGYGNEEYNNACIVADSYGENVIIKGKSVTFNSLTSNIMHSMFISIIKLIYFFQKNSYKQIPIQNICGSVCADLNEQNRDVYICSALSIPNDLVKLAIVKCLFWVESSQLSSEEINMVYSQIKNISINGGIIEQVISITFLFLTKTFIEFMKTSPEKVVQSKEPFLIAIDYLTKNIEICCSCPKHELDIKNNLTLSLLIFLNNMSCYPELKKIFADKTKSLLLEKILRLENNNIIPNCFPIEIEKCRSGFFIDNIFNIFRGERGIKPYSYNTLRIFIHLADLLMNIPSKSYYIIPNTDYEDILESVRNELLYTECYRVQMEKENFNNLYELKQNFTKVSSLNKKKPFNQKLLIKLDDNELKDEQNKFLLLFPEILNFLLGRISKSKISYYEQCWDDKFDKKINEIKYDLTISQSKKEEKPIIETNQEGLKNVLGVFKNNLRGEEFYPINNNKQSNNEYDYILKDMAKCSQYGYDLEHTERILSEENPHNSYLRTLIIVSFLRCIYALLEYPANKTIRNNMVRLIYKDNNLKEITLLVDSTKLVDCNISTKYLMIIRNVLVTSKHYFQQALAENSFPGGEKLVDKEYLNKLGIISYTIKKMLRVYKGELKLEDSNNKLFLSEISLISLIICNGIDSVHFTDDFSREKTLELMINYDIIQVLIQAIKDNMNSESMVFKNLLSGAKQDLPSSNKTDLIKEIKENQLMTNMMRNICNVMGTYMNKIPSTFYSIMEKLTKSYIFEKVNFRKTYLREIIKAKLFDGLKEKIKTSLNKKITYLSRGVFDFLHFKLYNKKLIMIITENGLEFINSASSDNSEDDFELVEFEPIPELSIKFDELELVIEFELINRVALKTKNNAIINCNFDRIHSSDNIRSFAKFYNPLFHIYIKTKLFNLNDDGEDESNRANNNEIGQETDNSNNNNYDLTPINNNNSLKGPIISKDVISPFGGFYNKNESQEKLKLNINSHAYNPSKEKLDNENLEDKLANNQTVILGSIHEAYKFDYVNSIFDDINYKTEKKVLVFKGTKLIIYNEIETQWRYINLPDMIKNNIDFSNYLLVKEGKTIGDFSSAFKLFQSIDLNDMLQVNFKGVDQIIFKFSNGFKFFKMYDDYSYISFKRAILKAAKEKSMEVFDDPYSQIN